jgi:hypothetical protein
MRRDSNGLYGNLLSTSFRTTLTGLSLGNFFATAVVVSLKIAVGVAYIQCIWLRLREKFVSLRTIDRAFDSLRNIFALVDWELLRKMDIAVFLAVTVWYVQTRDQHIRSWKKLFAECLRYLPVAALFPPAILSVGDPT